MGVALLLLFLQVLPGDRARHDRPGDRPGDVHALVRGRDRARPARLDRPRLRRGGRRLGAPPRDQLFRVAAAAARARDHRQRRCRVRGFDRRLRGDAVSVERLEHDDRLDAALLVGAGRADSRPERARDDRAPDHARDARTRLSRLPALRRRPTPPRSPPWRCDAGAG